jgi:hypothetical protein
MTPNIIRINFVAAVWISIGLGAVLVVTNWPHGVVPRFSGQGGGVYFGALVTFGQLLLWRFYYRDDETPSAAASMGVYLLFPVVAALIADGVNGTQSVLTPTNYLLVYLGLSHLVYSFWKWQEGNRSWLDP